VRTSEERVCIEREDVRRAGRDLNSSTFQLNLSRFCHKIHPKHPLTPPDTPRHPLDTT